MPDEQVCFSLAGEDVVALGERALLWPRERTLFVADVHFGKDATFRHARRWVPPGTTAHDLSRLDELLRAHRAERLVVLGDAFHSEHAREDATFDEIRAWRTRLDAAVVMVRGNHDLRAGELARRLDFQFVGEGHPAPPFALHHHPAERSGGYVLCGHLHPVVRARGAARQSLRVPCFWAGPHRCILPAFGGFTGGAIVKPARGDRVILVAGGKVMEAAPGASGRGVSRLPFPRFRGE